MIQSNEKVEQLILHAIVNWQEHMAALCYQEQNKDKYTFCPKRFIFGCACSFERKKIQKTLDTMVESGALSPHFLSGNSSKVSYKSAEKNFHVR
jgi:hypothetical protein